MSSKPGVGRRVLGVGFVAATLSGTQPVRARARRPSRGRRPGRQAHPRHRAVRAGGGTDIVGRILAEQLTQMFGQQVIVENKAGANGNLAAAIVAASDPDGYTLLFTNTSIMTIAPSIYSNLTFVPLRDFSRSCAWPKCRTCCWSMPTCRRNRWRS